MTAIAAPARERPILFSGQMVRAILDGTKTQTRRVVVDRKARELRGCVTGATGTKWLTAHGTLNDMGVLLASPYGYVGDRLRVAETWAVGRCADGFKPLELDPRTWLVDNGGLWYAADDAKPAHPISNRGKWRPGRFMPKAHGFWPSRISLEITGVRVESLNDISEADARREGVNAIEVRPEAVDEREAFSFTHGFIELWDSLNAKRGYGWDVNPFVWVIEFRRVA